MPEPHAELRDVAVHARSRREVLRSRADVIRKQLRTLHCAGCERTQTQHIDEALPYASSINSSSFQNFKLHEGLSDVVVRGNLAPEAGARCTVSLGAWTSEISGGCAAAAAERGNTAGAPDAPIATQRAVAGTRVPAEF